MPNTEILAQLLQLACQKCGSARALATRLNWDQANITRVRAGTSSMSAYRAAQVCDLLGVAPELGISQALVSQAKTPAERDYWLAFFESQLVESQLSTMRLIKNAARVKAASDTESQAERALHEAKEALDWCRFMNFRAKLPARDRFVHELYESKKRGELTDTQVLAKLRSRKQQLDRSST